MDLSAGNLKDKFLGLWQSSGQTGRQVVRGGVLIFFERFLIKGLYFVRTVILARLLFPDDFGLFGMATLAMNIPGVFTNPAFSSAIVQKKETVSGELNSVWTIYFIRSFVLALILFFGAPLAGIFFHNPAVIPFVKVLSLNYLLSGLESLGVTLLQKEMKFNKIIFYDISGVVAEVAVTIASAFVFRSAWALLLGAVAGRFVFTTVSYLVHPWRPRFNFHFADANSLFRFGKWLGVGGILAFFASQGDNLMVGRLLDASALGFYSMAFALGTLPAVEIARALGNILFPLYSKLQEDLGRLKSVFFRIASIVFSLTIPAAAGLLILAREIIGVVYGSRWLSMTSVLYVIVFLGLVKSFDFLSGPLLLGTGRARTSMYIQAVQTIIMFVLIFPFTRSFGIVGTALSVLVGVVVSQLNVLLILRKQLGSIFRELARGSILPIVASVIMMFVIFMFKKILPVNNVLILALFVFGGVGVYFISLFAIDRLFGQKFYKSLIWIKQNS